MEGAPSYKLAGKQGRRAFTFPPFPGRPPDAQIFPVFSFFFCNFVTTVVGTLRYNLCCLNFARLLQSLFEY